MIEQDKEINPNPEQIDLKRASVDLMNLMVYRLTLEKLLLIHKEQRRAHKTIITCVTCFLIACLLPLLFVDIASLLTIGEFSLVVICLSFLFLCIGKGAKDMKEIQETIETEVKEVKKSKIIAL